MTPAAACNPAAVAHLQWALAGRGWGAPQQQVQRDHLVAARGLQRRGWLQAKRTWLHERLHNRVLELLARQFVAMPVPTKRWDALNNRHSAYSRLQCAGGACMHATKWANLSVYIGA